MSKMPRIEIKTIPGTAEEITRHVDTEQKAVTTKKLKKRTAKKDDVDKTE